MKNYYSKFNLTDKERSLWETAPNYQEIPVGYYIDSFTTNILEEEQEATTKVELLTKLLKANIPKLTKKQQAVLELHLQGLTQAQIAKRLNVGQTTVQKTLHGNWDPNYNKYFGGVIPKLRKLITKELTDQGIDLQELLNKGFGEL